MPRSRPAPRQATPEPHPLRHPLLRHGWPWVVVWVVSRGWMLSRWAHDYRYISNDVSYYFSQLSQAGGLQVALREYPLPMVWLLDLLRLPVDGDVNLYVILFALAMALLDALFSWWLWSHHSRLAALYWMAFVFLLGPLVWFRYDLLAAVVVGAAVFVMATRPRASGALVALGAGIKLWPALLIAALLGRGREAIERLRAFAVTGLVLVVLALLSGGFARLVSPLTWQDDRGLQIESVWASVPMWLRAFGSGASTGSSRWSVQMSAYHAFEVFGPGVDVWLKLSTLTMVLGIAFVAVVAVQTVRLREVDGHVRAMAAMAIVLVMMVGNKTLSPQYLAWLGAVQAAWFGLSPRGAERVRSGAMALASLVLAASTQYIYPGHYIGLIGAVPAEAAVTRVLVVRNLLLVAMTIACCGWTLAALLGDAHHGRRRGEGLPKADSIATG